jgi:hypothetical protein
LMGGVINTIIVLAICFSILFVAYKGNQPMQVPQAPKGMTYFQFMSDRMDAAKTVKPSRCGWGMMVSLAVLGPIYSVVYTEAGIHPDGLLARGIAPDGTPCRGSGGTRLSGFHGLCWESRQRGDASSVQWQESHKRTCNY